jgi:hypothetical protein
MGREGANNTEERKRKGRGKEKQIEIFHTDS